MLQENIDNTDFFVFNAVCSLHIHVVLEEIYFNNYLWERENYNYSAIKYLTLAAKTDF